MQVRQTIVRLVTIGLVAGFALLSGCTGVNLNLPAVVEQPTGQRLPGKVVWHDLLTDKPAESRRFYTELFGWQFRELGIDMGLGRTLNYALIRHNGRLIGGMVDLNRLDTRSADKDKLSQWVILLSVGDIDRAVAAAKAGGGTILTPPTDFIDRGRLALIEDPQGATLALIQTRDGDPPDIDPAPGDFLWDELWTANVEEATAFYSRLAPYRAGDKRIDEQHSYRYLESVGEKRVGILPNPVAGLPPVWVTYVRVADPEAIVARVEALGGKVLLAPQPRDLGGQVALIADPSGAGIAIQTWGPSVRVLDDTE